MVIVVLKCQPCFAPNMMHISIKLWIDRTEISAVNGANGGYSYP
jgi:hypothetical protein